MLHNEQVWTCVWEGRVGPGGGEDPCMVSLYSEVQVEQVWACLGGGKSNIVRSGPRRTCLNMSEGGVPVPGEVQCITANGYVDPPAPGEQTDMTENITFATPLTGGKNINQGSIEFFLRITGCEFAVWVLRKLDDLPIDLVIWKLAKCQFSIHILRQVVVSNEDR